jgi:hypothetical protein
MKPSKFMDAVETELDRLGLSLRDLPALAFGSDADTEVFLTRLRSLSLGATWHDVFPDLPTHLATPREQWKNRTHRPLGPWDHPHPPATAVLHIGPSDEVTPVEATQLLADLQHVGLRVHSVGQPESVGPTHAFVVMDQQTSEEDFDQVVGWFNDHPTLEVYAISRNPFIDDLL